MSRLFVLLSLLLPLACHADEVQVAVAANFAAPMKELAAGFERATGHKVLSTVGATGKFYAQSSNGAPFEVLLSADEKTPARLEQEGAGVPGTRFTYAIGKLVLWSSQPGVADANALKAGKFTRLAIANPVVAPYGMAAIGVLDKLGLVVALAPKFAYGENIAQTYQFVASGNAQLGFVAMSQVFEGGKLTSGSAWVVPASLYSPIRQDAIVLAKGKGKPAVLAWMAYLKSEPARALIRAHGYDL